MGDEPADPSPTAVATTATEPGAGPDGGGPIGAAPDPVPVVAPDVDPEPGALAAPDDALELLPCSWCGASGPDIVPLVAGRGSRRHVVAAICPRCVDAESVGDGLSSLLVAAFGVLALASLWVWSTPGPPSSHTTAVIAVGWIVAVAAYGFQAVRAARAARHGAGGGPGSWRWAIPPLLGLFVAVAVLVDLPLRGRFALSRAAIASAADDASSGVVHHGRLVAYPGGLLLRVDGSTGVLVDARCGFFRRGAPDAASSSGAPDGSSADTGTSADTGATADTGSTGGGTGSGGAATGTDGAVGATHELVDVVDLGGGWRAGCLSAPAEVPTPAT